MFQRGGETLLLGVAGFARQNGGDDAIAFFAFLEVEDFVSDVGALDGARGAEDDEEFGAVERIDDGAAEIGIGGKGFLVAKDG